VQAGYSLRRDGRLLRIERGTIEGGSPLLESAAGLAGETVCGTLLAVAEGLQALLARCRELKPESGAGAVTCCRGCSSHAISGIERGRKALLHATLARTASGRSGDRSTRAAYLEHMNGIDAARKDKLLIFTAALLAERRKARGLKLNYPEAVALISAAIMEGARDGRSVSELMSWGATLLRREEVMEGVPEMIPTFRSKRPFRTARNSLPSINRSCERHDTGEFRIAAGDIEINAGRKTVTVKVVNTGDRPIQVGSHYHFYETNEALRFERKAAYGSRLNIASGTAVRFEPGNRARWSWWRSRATAKSTDSRAQ